MLVACDSDKPPPAPKVAPTIQTPVTKDVQAPKAAQAPAKVESNAESAHASSSPPAHELAPNIPVVPVVAKATPAKGEVVSKPATNTKRSVEMAVKTKSAQPDAPDSLSKRKPVASKSKPARQVVKETRLQSPKLDLSLPPEMVEQLEPPKPVVTKQRSALLPPLFEEKKGGEDFQLNGRLLSNEMQLQMRSDNRREVEGAALDFNFKQ